MTLHPQTEPSAVVNLRIHLWSALACLLGRQCIGPASVCAGGLANLTSHISCDRSCRTTRRSVQVLGRSQSFLSLVCIQAQPVSSSSSLALSEPTLSSLYDSPTGLFTAADSPGRMAPTCLCTSVTALCSQFSDVTCNLNRHLSVSTTLAFHLMCKYSTCLPVPTHDDRSSQCRSTLFSSLPSVHSAAVCSCVEHSSRASL